MYWSVKYNDGVNGIISTNNDCQFNEFKWIFNFQNGSIVVKNKSKYLGNGYQIDLFQRNSKNIIYDDTNNKDDFFIISMKNMIEDFILFDKTKINYSFHDILDVAKMDEFTNRSEIFF